jgi:hypothetical protein
MQKAQEGAAIAAGHALSAAREANETAIHCLPLKLDKGAHVVVSDTVYKSAAAIEAASGAQSIHEGMRVRLEATRPGTVVRVGEGGKECDIELDDGERKEGVALHEVSVPTLERDNHRNGVIAKQAGDDSFLVGILTGERTAEVQRMELSHYDF